MLALPRTTWQVKIWCLSSSASANSPSQLIKCPPTSSNSRKETPLSRRTRSWRPARSQRKSCHFLMLLRARQARTTLVQKSPTGGCWSTLSSNTLTSVWIRLMMLRRKKLSPVSVLLPMIFAWLWAETSSLTTVSRAFRSACSRFTSRESLSSACSTPQPKSTKPWTSLREEPRSESPEPVGN